MVIRCINSITMIGDIGGNPNGYNKDVPALTRSGSIAEQFLFLAGTILLGESRRHLAKPRTTWLQLLQVCFPSILTFVKLALAVYT